MGISVSTTEQQFNTVWVESNRSSGAIPRIPGKWKTYYWHVRAIYRCFSLLGRAAVTVKYSNLPHAVNGYSTSLFPVLVPSYTRTQSAEHCIAIISPLSSDVSRACRMREVPLIARAA
jgi:hypothetical protein